MPVVSVDILYRFIAFMGATDPDFKDIKRSEVKTTDPGSAQIYDYLRKHIPKKAAKHVAVKSPVSKAKDAQPTG